jgi:DNA polymerase III sliding clamp (beta) subunit (PCNA family)
MKVTVSIKELLAARIFASEDDSRYVLNSVAIETRPGAAPLIIATDGRRLVCINSQAEQPEDADVSEFTAIIATPFIKAFHALVKLYKINLFPWVTLEYGHGSKQLRAEFMGGRSSMVVEDGALIEGTYPKWRLVIPTGEKTPISELGLNPEYVGDFAKAAKLLESKDSLIQMNIYSASAAIEARVGGLPNFYAVIMPSKLATEMQYQPEFLGLMPQERAA